MIVITGADKGKTGKVLKVMSDDGKVLVEGINRVWKHVRPSQRYPQGGRIQKDALIQLSNVQVVDPTTGKELGSVSRRVTASSTGSPSRAAPTWVPTARSAPRRRRPKPEFA